jgi:glycosyltransferase involved in cell wall biosynthesis
MTVNILTSKKVFIAWAPYSQRSRSLAKELDMSLHLIHYLKFQRPLYAPFKYLLQAMHTLALLLKKRPYIVFVQDPPIFAALSVFLYSVLTARCAKYIIDAHTGALLHPWWKPFRGLQKFLYRRALTVITTNQAIAERVKSLGADSMVLIGPPIVTLDGESMPLSDKFNLVLVNTFSPDEPTFVVLEAVKDRSDVHLYVTGDVNKAPSIVMKTKPANVTFTGFLSENDYFKLLRGTDAIIVVTDTDYTLQLGTLEAISVGKPIITSDLSFLRSHLRKGTIHVPNTPNGLNVGISKAQQNHSLLSQEILELRQIHEEEWKTGSQKLHKLLVGDAIK